MADFGVIGLGSVGWAVINGLSRKYSYAGYDIIGDYEWNCILDARIIFVCVSTPEGSDGRLDCSQVESVLSRLSVEKYRGIVVVKSTVSVGFFDFALAKFPSLRLVYMPEFLRERNSYTWFLNPDRIVIAGDSNDINTVLSYFSDFSDAEIIRTDFRTAELGKLAHNAFIATKVSFTNEMEAICRRSGASPDEVMHIVYTDRRVKSGDHLMPGLGPYGGKCVPKDTDELRNFSGSQFLAAVDQVNRRCRVPVKFPKCTRIAVIIPTLSRMRTLKRALLSVASQTFKPMAVIVVADSSDRKQSSVRNLLSGFSTLNLHFIINEGKQNISGAINSGLEFLQKLDTDLEHLFVALLDDDDWWDRRYLENCGKFAEETNSDWVVSGIIRHDATFPAGQMMHIPESISISDFLKGNPNVQNSNLFVLAERILKIRGFDEGLYSTTDRDVCIRLLEIPGIRYSILRNHLVHHDARRESGRLSSPGSSIKRMGLETFYKKYRDLMTEDEKKALKERAKTLFKIEIS